jgi:hypothetical protein
MREETEREGFEPSVGGEPYTGLAILRLRPCSATSPSTLLSAPHAGGCLGSRCYSGTLFSRTGPASPKSTKGLHPRGCNPLISRSGRRGLNPTARPDFQAFFASQALRNRPETPGNPTDGVYLCPVSSSHVHLARANCGPIAERVTGHIGRSMEIIAPVQRCPRGQSIDASRASLGFESPTSQIRSHVDEQTPQTSADLPEEIRERVVREGLSVRLVRRSLAPIRQRATG